MSRYIRLRREGGLYFFTLVTHGRRPFLTSDLALRMSAEAWQTMRSRKSFDVVAVHSSDHLHCLWQLPENDNDFSDGGAKSRVTSRGSILRKVAWKGRERPHKFRKGNDLFFSGAFMNTVFDEEDLRRHFDYIHYNPVKHGLVEVLPNGRGHRFIVMFAKIGMTPIGVCLRKCRIWTWTNVRVYNSSCRVGRAKRNPPNPGLC